MEDRNESKPVSPGSSARENVLKGMPFQPDHALLSKFYTTLFERNPNPMYLFDPAKEQRVDVNQAFVIISGYTREQLLGGGLKESDLWPETEKLAAVPASAAGAEPVKMRLLTSRGEERLVALSAREINPQNSRLLLLMELSLSEEKFSKAFQNSLDLAAISSLDEGCLIDVNETFLSTLGYKREQIIGRKTRELNLWAPYEQRDRIIREISEKGSCKDIEVYIRKNNGDIITGLFSAIRMELTTGPVIFSAVKDITMRKKAETLLRIQRDLGVTLQSRSGLQETLECLLLQCLKIEELDAGGIYLAENGALRLVVHRGLPQPFIESASRFAADSPQAKLVMRGKPVYQHYSKLGLPMDDVREREGLKAIAIIPVRHEDKVIAVLNMTSHTCDEMPPAVCNILESIAGMIGGIIMRAVAEEKLRVSEEKYRLLFEKTADGILVAGLDDKKFRYANPAICRMLGYSAEEILSLHVSDIHPPDQLVYVLSKFEQQVKGEKTLSVNIPCLTRKKEIIYADINSTVISIDNQECIFGLFRNVTERRLLKQLEQEKLIREKMLLRTQRLASLGELTTALAHEIRQPLHVMKMITEGILYWENKNPRQDNSFQKHLDNLGKILKGIARIDGVIDNVYKCTNRSNEITVEMVNLNQVIREMTAFFRQKMDNHGISLVMELDPAAREIKFSGLQAEQVITNLLSNAIQSLDTAAEPSKQIRISTKERDSYLLLEISDNGPGIPGPIRENIFNPLFSTRQKNTSLGMGLYIVHNILDSFRATIDFRDNPEGGVTFRIKFTREE